MYTTSKHVSEERMDRIGYIIDVFKGCFGKEEFYYECENDRRMVLTSKGIIFIQGISNPQIITMYIATVSQATYIYRHSHTAKGKNMPQKLYNQILKNQKLFTKEYYGVI